MVLSLASSPPHTTTNDANSHLPHFSGEYPLQWISQAQRYFAFHEIYDDDRFPYVIEVFEDEPFSWFNSWFRGPERLTWKSFTTAMLHRFHPTTASNSPILDVTTTVTKTDIKVATYNTPPSPLPPIIQIDMATFHLTTRHQTYEFLTPQVKLKAEQVWFWLSVFITSSFRCAKTYYLGHRCHPPKLVFIQSQDEPPWEPRERRYKTIHLGFRSGMNVISVFLVNDGNLGLEDKAVF